METDFKLLESMEQNKPLSKEGSNIQSVRLTLNVWLFGTNNLGVICKEVALVELHSVDQ